MENQKAESIASQTEIPVSQVSNGKSNKGRSLPRVDKKVLAAVLVLVILVVAGSYFLLRSGQKTNGYAASYNTGDYGKASEIVDKGLKQNGSNPSLLAEKIQLNSTAGNQTGQEQKQLENSMPYIEKLIATNPQDAATLIVIGYAYETGGEYEKAIEYYDKAIKADPTSSNAWFHKGHALAFLGKSEESNKSYAMAKSLDPLNPFVLIVEANRLYGQQSYEEAYRMYKKAADTPGINDATKSEALTGASLARGLPTYNNITEALELSRQALQAGPNFSPALSAYGYNLYVTGDKTGIEYINKAISANPRISKNYYLLAMFSRGEKHYQESITYNLQALSKVANDNTIVTPGDKAQAEAKIKYELAKTYWIMNQRANVLNLLQEAVAEYPAIKANIKQDYEQNLFYQDLSQTSQFQQLISS